jgi:hypothetical protein
LPFIDINGLITHGFYVIVNSQLHAADGRQHADNTEYTKGNAQQGQESPKLIGTEFLQGHPEAGPYDLPIPKHNSNIRLHRHLATTKTINIAS